MSKYTSNTTNYYYEKNHIGSIFRITSNTGGIVDEYSYTVFGKAYRKNTNGVYKPVAGANDSAIGNTRLYTGREYDKEISLYYMRARFYDAGMGRFISRDPIGMKDNINLYTYVANNPMKYVDRMGLEKKIVGTLRIYSMYGDYFDPFSGDINPITFLDGHGWIELTSGDEVTTYGIGRNWKDSDYAISRNSDVTKNLEKDRGIKSSDNVISLGLNINQVQLNTINNYISSSVDNGYEWGYFSPCTDFASNIWNMVSDVDLGDRSFIGVSNPDSLAKSITEVILMKQEYESERGDISGYGNVLPGSNGSSNPYRNIIY